MAGDIGAFAKLQKTTHKQILLSTKATPIGIFKKQLYQNHIQLRRYKAVNKR